MRVREPVARPLDVVAVELLLTASQAFLVGVLLYMAIGFWEDAGVGLGSQAAILALLGLGVGGAWLYWLVGGVGWPMAAANAAAGLFFLFALVMHWTVEAFDIGGAPLLLATVSAVFGVVAGVFIDSPRRWRWDQREKLRPGTRVPRVSPATRAFAARVPRTLPRRQAKPEPVSELAARIGSTTPAGPAPSPAPTAPAADVGRDQPDSEAPSAPTTGPEPELEHESSLSEAPPVPGTPLDVPEAPEPVLPTDRLSRGAAAGSSQPESEDDEAGIDLPTMVEPKAQRSPWAWAAPPQWNRDEEDEPRAGRSSGRS